MSLTRSLVTAAFTAAFTTGFTATLPGALTLGTAAADAAPAAGVDSHRDAVRDVLSAPLESDALPHQPEAARTLGDITKNTATFVDDLVVTTRFRSLAATGYQQFTWSILTSKDAASHEAWSASLFVQPHRNRGNFSLIDPIANQPDCGAAVVDRAARTVTLTVSGDCLGNPTWVKVGNGVTFTNNGRVFLDDARREGGVTHAWRYGPQLDLAVS